MYHVQFFRKAQQAKASSYLLFSSSQNYLKRRDAEKELSDLAA